MTNIKSINFTFENCESLTLSQEYIACFNTGKIYDNFNSCMNHISLDKSVEGFTCVIKKDAIPLGDDFTLWLGDSRIPAMTRFKQFQDITQIFVKFEDETSVQMNVEWHEDCDQNNLNQKCIITDEGNYLIFSDGSSYVNNICKDMADFWCE